jgi:hypothetical protein
MAAAALATAVARQAGAARRDTRLVQMGASRARPIPAIQALSGLACEGRRPVSGGQADGRASERASNTFALYSFGPIYNQRPATTSAGFGLSDDQVGRLAVPVVWARQDRWRPRGSRAPGRRPRPPRGSAGGHQAPAEMPECVELDFGATCKSFISQRLRLAPQMSNPRASNLVCTTCGARLRQT